MIWCIKTYIIAYVKTKKYDSLSIMSNLQPNCCLKFDFQKVDQHAGGKWLITNANIASIYVIGKRENAHHYIWHNFFVSYNADILPFANKRWVLIKIKRNTVGCTGNLGFFFHYMISF